MLNVVYEDNQILVVIKPQNIPTQEDSSKDKDLLTMCKEYIKEKYNKPGEVYLGMVQRLDRPTGGLIVFARTSKSAKRLCEAIKNEEFKKKYLAVVMGQPKERKAHLTHYLKKDMVKNKVYIAPSLEEGAKKAELDYQVLDTEQNMSLVEVALQTGRSHQIRVQMQSLQTPIFADGKYGQALPNKKLALWAYNLEFVHPTLNKTMKFISLPDIDEKPWEYFSKPLNNLCL